MASSVENSLELIEEFCKVTGVEPERAKLFLEAAGWNYNLAIGSFYEEEDDDDSEEVTYAGHSQTPPNPSSPQAQPPTPQTPAASSRIVTMSSLIQHEEKSDEEGQAFYAGGSLRSGQQVLGPGKGKRHHIVEEMFKAAKSHGAEVVEPTETRCSSAHLRVFRGSGHILGATSDDSNAVPSIETSSDPTQRMDICLRAWRTGFTVDNGPLRDYSDPQNNEFLGSIRKGEIPQELIHKARGGEVSLNIEDHSHEDYVPPKQSLLAFSGQGHRLGSPTPRVAGLSSIDDVHKCKAEAEKLLNVNQSQPVTTIQVRLADGSRITLKLNHSHTVGDIRQYIVMARPEYSASVFTLMTAFPPSELADDNATVKDANLLNSVIVQKML